MRNKIGLILVLMLYTAVSLADNLEQALLLTKAYVHKSSQSLELKSKFMDVSGAAQTLSQYIDNKINISKVSCENGKIAFVNSEDFLAFRTGTLSLHFCSNALIDTSAEELAQTIIHELLHLVTKESDEDSVTKKELLIVLYGGGAPSLSYLQDFPIADVKIEEIINEPDYEWFKDIGIKSTDDFLIAQARSYAITAYSKRIQAILNLFGDKKNLVLNQQDQLGFTPLMLAVRENNIDCVKVLLKNGANLHLKAKSGETARDIAVKYRRQEMMSLL